MCIHAIVSFIHPKRLLRLTLGFFFFCSCYIFFEASSTDGSVILFFFFSVVFFHCAKRIARMQFTFFLSPTSTTTNERYIFLAKSIFAQRKNGKLVIMYLRTPVQLKFHFNFPMENSKREERESKKENKVKPIPFQSPWMNDWWPCVIQHNVIITQSSVNKIIELEIVLWCVWRLWKTNFRADRKWKNGKRINLAPKWRLRNGKKEKMDQFSELMAFVCWCEIKSRANYHLATMNSVTRKWNKKHHNKSQHVFVKRFFNSSSTFLRSYTFDVVHQELVILSVMKCVQFRRFNWFSHFHK